MGAPRTRATVHHVRADKWIICHTCAAMYVMRVCGMFHDEDRVACD